MKRAAPASVPYSQDLSPKNYYLSGIIACVEDRYDDIIIDYLPAGLALGAGSVEVTAINSQQGRDGGICLVEKNASESTLKQSISLAFSNVANGRACMRVHTIGYYSTTALHNVSGYIRYLVFLRTCVISDSIAGL